MKRIRVYAVVDVADDCDASDIIIDATRAGDTVLRFLSTADGYRREFAKLGADPGLWPDPNDCPECCKTMTAHTPGCSFYVEALHGYREPQEEVPHAAE